MRGFFRIHLPAAFIVVAACSEGDLPTGIEPIERDAVQQQVAYSEGTDGGGSLESSATVTTDKRDYKPGDRVTIAGAGWAPGELVHLQIVEDPPNHPEHHYEAVADENGAFVYDQLVLDELHQGVRFTLTATGQTSGKVATATFTDGNLTGAIIMLTESDCFTPLSLPAGVGTVCARMSLTITGSGTTSFWVLWTSPGNVRHAQARSTPGSGTVTATALFDVTEAGTWTVEVCAFVPNPTCPDADRRASREFEIVGANEPPTAHTGGPYSGDEGSPIQLDGSGSADSDGTIAAWAWTLGTFDTPATGSCSFDGGVGNVVNPSVTCTDTGTLTIGLVVTDDEGTSSTVSEGTVTINDVVPTITGVMPATVDPVHIVDGVARMGITANLTGYTGDTFTGQIYCDSEAAADFDGTATLPSFMHECEYTQAGVYQVRATIRDEDGAGTDDEKTYEFVVVVDPSAGFVTGGGWIDSPAGAAPAYPEAIGKASFGFVSKYRNGAEAPDGSTQFQFRAGNIDFHSMSYDRLVVSGPRAQFRGAGNLNGVPGYAFMLSAIDGQVSGGGGMDRFRIKILDSLGNVVYDNQMGASDGVEPATALAGGSIVIHTGGNSTK